MSVNAVVENPDARIRAMVSDHFDFIWRTTRRLGLREEEADDATQRAFIVASRRLGEIKSGSERSFLFGVALNIVAETRRAFARRREVAEESEDARVDPAPPQDELVDRRRARAILDEVVEVMPADARAVFVLFELEQMTMAEVAELLDLAPGTVASRLRRAREIFDRKITTIRARSARAQGGGR